MDSDAWRRLAKAQGGMISRRQLRALGVDRFRVRNQVAAGRWVERTPMVIGTTTGTPTREQLMWLGLLHAGPRALIGDLTAAEVAGLRNWAREDITVLVPDDTEVDDVDGITFVRTRRDLPGMRDPRRELPTSLPAPAILHFGAYQHSRRTAQGAVAAAVQQRIVTPEQLALWVDAMRPLRWARMFRQVIGDIAGGSQSVAELDVLRLCRAQGLRSPDRQTRRRDATGRVRYTDCEWTLPDGRVIVLEVDGSFHMDVEHWEDDLARQRRLSDPHRLVVRCTAREVRDEPDRLGSDLRRLGVPGRAAWRARQRTLDHTTRS
jgi:very-short-patch-repair endonuclease